MDPLLVVLRKLKQKANQSTGELDPLLEDRNEIEAKIKLLVGFLHKQELEEQSFQLLREIGIKAVPTFMKQIESPENEGILLRLLELVYCVGLDNNKEILETTPYAALLPKIREIVRLRNEYRKKRNQIKELERANDEQSKETERIKSETEQFRKEIEQGKEDAKQKQEGLEEFVKKFGPHMDKSTKEKFEQLIKQLFEIQNW